jgi:hypothetical protein
MSPTEDDHEERGQAERGQVGGCDRDDQVDGRDQAAQHQAEQDRVAATATGMIRTMSLFAAPAHVLRAG